MEIANYGPNGASYPSVYVSSEVVAIVGVLKHAAKSPYSLEVNMVLVKRSSGMASQSSEASNLRER